MNIAPYQARCTVMNGVREIAGWKLKIYTIHEKDPQIESVVLDAAIQYASIHVDWPLDRKGHGFLIVHVGNEAVWLLVDLWADDILRHFLFRAPIHRQTEFGDGPRDGTMACVWELEIFIHERNSWVKHVLSRPDDPDFDSYLLDDLEINL